MAGKRVRSTQHIVSLDSDTDDPDEDQLQGLPSIEACEEEERQITFGFIEACAQQSPHIHQQILSTPPAVATPQPSK